MFKALRKKLKDQRGLTLIELLAVIVILGIIAAIAVPSIGNIVENSREDAIKAEALQILNAANIYVAENGKPASNAAVLKSNLEPKYLEPTDYFKDSAYTISVSGDVFLLTGAGKKGNTTLTFTSASKKHINDDADQGSRTIPKP